MSKEIKIRDLSASVVAKIDEQAKMIGKSRNEFLKEFLEMHFLTAGKVQEIDSKYEQLLSRTTKVIEYNSILLGNIADELLINFEEEIKEKGE